MTPENLTDRELNEAVHVHVMNNELTEDYREWVRLKEIVDTQDGALSAELLHKTRLEMYGVQHQVHSYYDDIAAAWEVVEKIQGLGWRYAMYDDDDDDPWNYTQFSKNEKIVLGASSSAPRAICLAALKAVGVE